ncbi:MAG: guanylate kinase [Planctomycetes bacterium]|nr:guanylate kinase [Planctomycetota bacterium]
MLVKGPLIVLSGPSGSGKSTVIDQLLADRSLPLRLSVSATTRSPRPGEKEGVQYHFWSRERFQDAVERGEFLEWAEVFGNRYGTPRAEVEPYRDQGTGVLLEIDVKGWEQVRRHCPDLVSIFLRTSSLETYEQRLRARRTESDEAIQRRLQGARDELARAGEYSYQVINDNLDRAVAEVRSIVQKQLFN